MEYVVIGTIISLGYLLSKKEIKNRYIVDSKNISNNKLPNNSNQTQQIEKDIHKVMKQNYKKVFDNYKGNNKNKNNIIIPGPPKEFGIANITRFNQVNTSAVPVEANNYTSNNLII